MSVDIAALTDDAVEAAGNEKTLAELTMLLDPSVYTYIESCKTACEAWDALVKAFEDSGVVKKIALLEQWIFLKLTDCESMQYYVNKCLVLRSKVKNAGFEID